MTLATSGARVRSDLRRAVVIQLLADRTVRVGVHSERRALWWISDADRERVWSAEIEPRFYDGTATDPPGQLPFHGTL